MRFERRHRDAQPVGERQVGEQMRRAEPRCRRGTGQRPLPRRRLAAVSTAGRDALRPPAWLRPPTRPFSRFSTSDCGVPAGTWTSNSTRNSIALSFPVCATSVTSAGPSRPARPPCRRRTTWASLGLRRRAPRARGGRLGPPKRALQVRRRCVSRLSGVHTAGQPSRDLLGQPRIVVGIGEGEERPVAGALGVGTRLPCLDRKRRAVPDVAHLDAAADKLGMGGLDVGDDQSGLGRAGRGRRESQAEGDRGRGAGRRELDDPKTVHRGDVIVEPPPQAARRTPWSGRRRTRE